MDSFIPMGGFQLPFQRRLSRLYNDTKKSSDFVKEPVQNAEDPEIKALHRKLRIQKDRLVSWGLEWSDPSQSAEILIDSSLSKAGLSEVVGSIMSTIKDILAEAEPLWHSSRKLAGSEKGYESEKSRDQKFPLVVWDKGRFEDLVRDLTTSIDTLYDLSRTRSSYAQSSEVARQRLFKTTSAEDLRPFESSRMQTPQLIDPQTLTNLRDMQAEPMTEVARDERSREIVFMSRQAYSELTSGSANRQQHSPLLLEFAAFDPIYSMTGVMPPMTRFEKMSAGLQREPQRSPGSWSGLPQLLGYFEDMEHSRLGLVYQFPTTFNPVSFEHLTQNPLYNLCSLADLLARPDFEPKLEAKFRLASNLANTVFDMHARGITHGDLTDENISFCNAVGTDPGVSGLTTGEVDIRRPLLSSFDLFSDANSLPPTGPFSLYKHPLDPRATIRSPLAVNSESQAFDLHGLAMLLLSIGLWTKLEDLAPNPASLTVPESVLEQLAIRCGTLYTKAVQTCWNAVDQEMEGHIGGEQVIARAQLRASRYLEACCILDGVSNLEERLSDDLGEARSQMSWLTTMTAAGSSKADGPSKASKSEKPLGASATNAPAAGKLERGKDSTTTSSSPAQQQPVGTQKRSDVREAAEPTPKKPSPKMRLYPQVRFRPEVIDQWNTFIMPQINMALSHFYRKHPETVEISLESVGESPLKTQPTVIVICNSVNKVRAILKQKLGVLFDGSTGFGLKVCKGQVRRSRNCAVGRRSMARGGADDGGDADETVAANPDFQERPRNGASIGAWIGDRHLPPVSFGGVIMVDDKPYGMTVHHMLDDPDQDEDMDETRGLPRSMARQQSEVLDLAAWYAQQYQTTDSEAENSGAEEEEDFACEFSDSDSDSDSGSYTESAFTSESSDYGEFGEEEDQFREPGDIPGVSPGCEAGYMVTQPALDDVEEGFYPSPETQDEDHLDTYSLGKVYASSGIRRRCDDGLIHEVDWALFEFHDDRLPADNSIPRVKSRPHGASKGQRKQSAVSPGEPTLHPTAVAPASALPGLEVQCMARTSGLQTGVVLQTLSSVKIYGRQSASHTYQISGTPSAPRPSSTRGARSGEHQRPLPMGVPGDSGAWIVDREHGHVCGHVLAWSERKRVAYMCPMEVLLKDIAETLDAGEIRLPGGEVVVTGPALYDSRSVGGLTDLGEEADDGSVQGWVLRNDGSDPQSLEAVFGGGPGGLRQARKHRRRQRREVPASEMGGGGVGEELDDEGVEMQVADVADEIGKLQISGKEELHGERVPV